MVKAKKQSKREVTVCLDEELAVWMEGKALEGYKKASFIRAVLHREKELEEDATEFLRENDAKEPEGDGDADADLFGDEDGE